MTEYLIIISLFCFLVLKFFIIKKLKKEKNEALASFEAMKREENASKQVINDMLEANQILAEKIYERDEIYEDFKDKNLSLGQLMSKKISELKKQNSEMKITINALRENFSEGY